jgi:hypothetical protein
MKYSAFILFLCLFFVGCVKRFKFTVPICNKLYVEIFNINPAGVDEDYLTDSTSFRFYVGNFDNEHENYRYICEGDSIKIEKFAENDKGLSWQTDNDGRTYLKGDTMKVVEVRTFKLLDLKKKGF